jgi:hypothetical protein
LIRIHPRIVIQDSQAALIIILARPGWAPDLDYEGLLGDYSTIRRHIRDRGFEGGVTAFVVAIGLAPILANPKISFVADQKEPEIHRAEVLKELEAEGN